MKNKHCIFYDSERIHPFFGILFGIVDMGPSVDFTARDVIIITPIGVIGFYVTGTNIRNFAMKRFIETYSNFIFVGLL
jgi:hypothetical protein